MGVSQVHVMPKPDLWTLADDCSHHLIHLIDEGSSGTRTV